MYIVHYLLYVYAQLYYPKIYTPNPSTPYTGLGYDFARVRRVHPGMASDKLGVERE